MSVAKAAKTDDRLNTLVALRDTLAEAIDGCDSLRDLSSLSRQMTVVLVEIETLAPPEQKGDAVNEIAERRAARGAGSAKGSTRTKRAQ